MTVTVEHALRQIRSLHSVDAGRLRGESLRDRNHRPVTTGELPARWAGALSGAVAARHAGTITATTPEYVVYSGDTPVAWLTVHAQVIVPPAGADGVRAEHQRQAVEALCHLHPWVLRELADLRDIRDNGGRNAVLEHEGRIGRIRVAPHDDPTNTTWVDVSGDYYATAAHAGRTVAALGELPLRIISARGYGAYGQHAARLDLKVLCAMHVITATHTDVGLVTVGNWLAAGPDGSGRVGDPPWYEAVPADRLPALFTAAYRGRYASRSAYLQQHRHPDPYQIEHHQFTNQVYAVAAAAPPGGVAVFARRPVAEWASPTPGAEQGETP